MSSTICYKGYDGSLEYSEEDRVFHGRIAGIRDVVTFEGDSVAAIEANFRHAVNEYLDFCAEQGKEPDKPFSGTFNVRTGRELHRRAALYAEQRGQKLNSVVKDALEKYLQPIG
jgi:predicted HicB family RNase H-like nuclease